MPVAEPETVSDVDSGDEPTELVSARTGSGRSAAQTIETELPPGPAVLTITRGSDVRFELTSEATIQATAVPRNEDDARNLLLLAGVVIRLTSTMSSSHSIPCGASWACAGSASCP